MKLTKHSIKGIPGITICYTLPNIRIDGDFLKWDAFRFYSPEGTKKDEKEGLYFDVPAEEILIQRDTVLDKELIICVSLSEGVEVIEILEGADRPEIQFSTTGDIIISGYIPANTAKEVSVNFKEVSNG